MNSLTVPSFTSERQKNCYKTKKEVPGTLTSVVSLLRLFSSGLVYIFPQSANDK
jgi:hypothetical protein